MSSFDEQVPKFFHTKAIVVESYKLRCSCCHLKVFMDGV
jgi:hypothetical protein